MFNCPAIIVLDDDGTTLYVADSENNRIRMIRNNQVSTLAGNGIQGFADGAAAEASFRQPSGVAIDREGVVYVADRYNNRIRMIRDGQVSTLAGSTTQGFADGAAHQSTFRLPFGVTIDLAGSISLSDAEHNRIRKLDNGQVSTVAGSGSRGVANGAGPAALFTYPCGVAVDQTGTIYVADAHNHLIRMIRNGEVSTFAGSGERGFADGPSHLAAFRLPCGIAVDLRGHVYVADQGNNRIRMIRDGQVSTLAGNGTEGFADGPAAQAMFRSPGGVSVDRNSNVYVADTNNNRIRMILDGQVSTLAGGPQQGFADGPTLIPFPAMSLTDHSTKLERAKGVSTDFTLQINAARATQILHRSPLSATTPVITECACRSTINPLVQKVLVHRSNASRPSSSNAADGSLCTLQSRYFTTRMPISQQTLLSICCLLRI
jgi:DNA-binding beta-propeller fold protein YncE